ncbi:HAMP domain-containing protein [Desulfosarcina sp. OttesenSCG-928-A07]|nr:HAMP domain-containing protein [Desulfosarcina sp. OttesenSCG-928-A07]
MKTSPPFRPNRKSTLPPEEHKRRKRELIIGAIIVFAVMLLTFVGIRLATFGVDMPVSNSILLFILINIILLLLILLIFLVFRNLVKLIYARRRKVMGARLRTRLVVAFVGLSLLPTTVLFFLSINFVTSSIEFWVTVPVEQALERALQVGQTLYRDNQDRHQFFIQRIAFQVQRKNMVDLDKRKELDQYIHVVQREFDIDLVEVYSARHLRVAYAAGATLASDIPEALPRETVVSYYAEKQTHPLSLMTPQGELLRTIGTVPFGVAPEHATAYISLGELISADLSENMDAITHGMGEYQQIKLLKKPIQVFYYLLLSLVALLVLFSATWFGFHLAKTITTPIMDLAEGTRRVADGDLTVTIANTVSDDEIGLLVDAFNNMTRDLRSNRRELELSAQKLTEQNLEIEKRRQYMETVLKNVSGGVITTDADGVVTTFNKAAERLLNVDAGGILDKHYRNLLKPEYLQFAEEIVGEVMAARGKTLELPIRVVIGGQPRTFFFYVTALRDDHDHIIGFVMVFDDLTEQEKAQRMAAWREVARRIAHEVKNPLTPISLSAQRLKRRYSYQINDPVFDECTRMIIDHVDLIRNLVNEFSTFARFPTANPKPGLLPPIIEETVALYREGHPNIIFDIHIDPEIPVMNLDRQQFKQALINLVNNAAAAIRNRGRVSISATHDAILKQVRIEVADDGPGISDADKIRLFEPNFSTKKAGMGLGLTIVNSIVSDHQGMIRVQDNSPKGAKFVIELPV